MPEKKGVQEKKKQMKKEIKMVENAKTKPAKRKIENMDEISKQKKKIPTKEKQLIKNKK